MRWPWQKRDEPRALISISDPVLAGYFGVGNASYAGVAVGESTALGISAVYRAVALISQTIASLPARSLRDAGDGRRERVTSFLDNPSGDLNGPTPFEFWETVYLHLLLHGNAFLAHVRNGGGGLAGLVPIHPLQVQVEWQRDGAGKPTGRKAYTATLDDGQRKTYTDETMTHIPAMCLDGLRGLSPIAIARNSLGTAVAGDRAAAKMFSDGAMFSGIVTPEEDVTEDEVKRIKAGLNRTVTGWENASTVAVVNRKLKFTQWSMSMEDAQFLQSRQFQVEEVARWYGIPPFALMQTEKQTSWGTGIESQQRGLGRTVLAPWAVRVQQRVSRLLPAPRLFEWDFAGLERSDPTTEIRLLLEQIRGGLITVNEARAIRNMPAMEGGDELQPPQGFPTAPNPPDSEGAA